MWNRFIMIDWVQHKPTSDHSGYFINIKFIHIDVCKFLPLTLDQDIVLNVIWNSFMIGSFILDVLPHFFTFYKWNYLTICYHLVWLYSDEQSDFIMKIIWSINYWNLYVLLTAFVLCGFIVHITLISSYVVIESWGFALRPTDMHYEGNIYCFKTLHISY